MQYQLVCEQCGAHFDETKIYTHKFGCPQSTFSDICFELTKENMLNVLSREIQFMLNVMEKDLENENPKLRDDGLVYELTGGQNAIMIVAGK